MFISLQKRLIDPESNKVQPHKQDFFDEQMCTEGKHMSLTVAKKKILMERSGFSLLFSTLDYMHLFFDLYVLKKYNQYFFQLILKISLSYSDQAQQPLKRKRKKSLARSKTALKFLYQNCTRSQWKDWVQTLIKFIKLMFKLFL